MESNTSSKLIPAATVVVVRDGDDNLECLLLRRNTDLSIHGGAWVFPGGKVDDEDADLSNSDELAIARIAACREVLEEAGINLSKEKLLPISHWTTPKLNKRRFSTWFFVAECSDQSVSIDDSEIKSFTWAAPSIFLSRHAKNEVDLAPATFVTLRWLSSFESVSTLMKAMPVEPEHYLPKTVDTESGKVSLYQGDAGYENTDISIRGKSHRLIMEGRPFRYLKGE